jgi:hypothetical protein
MALDDRDQYRREPGGEQRRAAEVETARAGDPRLRDHTRRGQEGRNPDRDVDQEAGPPTKLGDVGLDECPANDLAADRSQPERHAVNAERASIGLVTEADRDDREHLRHYDRASGALDDARRDQRRRRRSESARCRGEREERHAGHVDAPAPETISRACREDQECGEAQAVSGHDPDQRAGARVQVDRDGRQSDVDDEEVENDHDGACEQGRQALH